MIQDTNLKHNFLNSSLAMRKVNSSKQLRQIPKNSASRNGCAICYSARSPESEFDELGLTREVLETTQAPFVKEGNIKYVETLEGIIPIKLNNTFLVIGKINHVKLEDNILSPDGFLELDKVLSLCSNGVGAYYSTQLIDRYEYARPGAKPVKIGQSNI